MHNKHKKEKQQAKQNHDPEWNEIKWLIRLSLIAFIITAFAFAQIDIQFNLLPLAYAEDQRLWLKPDLNSPNHAGTGSSCPTITGPSSATDSGGNTITHSDDSDSAGCTFNSWTLDRTTTNQQLPPKFFNKFLSEIEVIHSQTSTSTFSRDCEYYNISGLGIDPRLNITAAYDVIGTRTDRIGGITFGQCDSAIARSQFDESTAILTDFINSMGLNNTFFSYGVNIDIDERDPPTFDNTVSADSFIGFVFENPTELNNTIWMMQEHPKFPTGNIDGGSFDISDVTFTMNSDTLDDTKIGQVVLFKEFNKTIVSGIGFNITGSNMITDPVQAEQDAQNYAGDDGNGKGIFISPNGTKFYLLGDDGNDVNEYNLNTAWDTTTRNFQQTFSVSTETTTPNGIFFRNDGLKMYVLSRNGGNGGEIHEYDLSNAWDVSSATLNQSVADLDKGNPTDIWFDENGDRLYLATGVGGNITQYDVNTSWDISTISEVQAFDITTELDDALSVWFNPLGTTMLVTGNDGGLNNPIVSYTLSTAWDISTSTFVTKRELSFTIFNIIQDTTFSPDGTKMFVVDQNLPRVAKYDLAVVETATTFLPNIRVTGNYQSQTSSTDQWIRIELKDGSYGTQQITSFPENQNDNYQSGGSLGVVHLESSTSITPFDVSFTPNWSNSTEDTITLFISVDDNSTTGSTIANITSVQLSKKIQYDFNDINLLQFYETSPNEDVSGIHVDPTRTAFNDYDAGFVNVTDSGSDDFSPPTLPQPTTPNAANAINISNSRINVSWQHDILNVTDFQISRESPIGNGFVKLLDTNNVTLNYEDTGLTSGTEYNYEICAINGDVIETTCITASATTNTVPASPPAFDVENFTATANLENVLLEWDHDQTNTTDYEISRNGTLIVPSVKNTFLESATYFDDFETDNGWISHNPSIAFIDTGLGVINVTDSMQRSIPNDDDQAFISFNVGEHLGITPNPDKFSLRTSYTYLTKATSGVNFMNLIGVSQFNATSMGFGCVSTSIGSSGAVTNTGENINCLVLYDLGGGHWRQIDHNSTLSSNFNLNLTTTIPLFTTVYPEVIVDYPYIKSTVYSDADYTTILGNGFVTDTRLIDGHVRLENFTHLWFGSAGVENFDGDGQGGSWDYVAFWNNINVTDIAGDLPTSYLDTSVQLNTVYNYTITPFNDPPTESRTDGNSTLANEQIFNVIGTRYGSETNNSLGSSCPTNEKPPSTTPSPELRVSPSNSILDCERNAVEWDISTIPTDAIINSATLTYNVDVVVTGSRDCQFRSMENQPSLYSDGQDFWNDVANGTLFHTSSDCRTVSTGYTFPMTPTVISDLQDNLENNEDWWGIGYKFDSETRQSSTSHRSRIEVWDLTVSYNGFVLTNDVPAQVQNLTGSYINPDTINLNWNTVTDVGNGNPVDPVLTIVEYRIYDQDLGGGPFILTGTTITNTANDTEKFPQEKEYIVSACNEIGCGTNSTLTQILAIPISVPVLTASDNIPNGINSTWTMQFQDGITGYSIFNSSDNITFDFLASVPNMTLFFFDSPHPVCFEQYYKVSPFTSTQNGTNSTSDLGTVNCKFTPTFSDPITIENIGDTFKLFGNGTFSGGNLTKIQLFENGTVTDTNNTFINFTSGPTDVISFDYLFWERDVVGGIRNFTVTVFGQSLNNNIESISDSGFVTREYDPDHFDAIVESQGLVNFTHVRSNDGENVFLKVNRIAVPDGETWKIECIYQNVNQAIDTKDSIVPETPTVDWQGLWHNTTDTGYFNSSYALAGGSNAAGTHIYISCFNDDLLFSTTSFTNSSLALFGIDAFDTSFGSLIGVPAGIFMLVLMAGMANKRTSPTWLVVITGAAGVMSLTGFFTLDPIVWGLALFTAMLGLFVNQKVF